MQYMPQGSLYHLLKTDRVLLWKTRKVLAKDICSALLYLHKKNILHRDLKSLNILVSTQDNQLRAHLTDFGLSIVRKKTTSTDTENGPIAGTLLWMSPELLQGSPCSLQSDMYAFGMILWELASRTIPFKGKKKKLIHQLIITGKTPPIPPDTPENLAKLIKLCWSMDPLKRPTINQALAILNQNGKQPYATSSSPTISVSTLNIVSKSSKRPVSLSRRRKKLLSQVITLLAQIRTQAEAPGNIKATDQQDAFAKTLDRFSLKKRLSKTDESEILTIKRTLLTDQDSDDEPSTKLLTTFKNKP